MRLPAKLPPLYRRLIETLIGSRVPCERRSGWGIWWGENLAGAQSQPVRLSDPTKLVYSPHTYGPGTFMQSYFSDAAFPGNLAALWRSRFAFLAEQGRAPVVIGEMGGWYVDKDRQWQDWAVSYMKEKGIGIFYFVLQVRPHARPRMPRAPRSTPPALSLIHTC